MVKLLISSYCTIIWRLKHWYSSEWVRHHFQFSRAEMDLFFVFPGNWTDASVSWFGSETCFRSWCWCKGTDLHGLVVRFITFEIHASLLKIFLQHYSNSNSGKRYYQMTFVLSIQSATKLLYYHFPELRSAKSVVQYYTASATGEMLRWIDCRLLCERAH